jgi:3-deoxy-D-manno-octulosonate 8-phosphate phosphatase KdsC-like HAD superfamily phosphatase
MAGAQLSEELALVASIPPAVGQVGAVSSDVVDMKLFRRALFVLTVGAYAAADATINVQVFANTANSTSGGRSAV